MKVLTGLRLTNNDATRNSATPASLRSLTRWNMDNPVSIISSTTRTRLPFSALNVSIPTIDIWPEEPSLT
uniref:Uncharacterized protein n=1 Tax=Tetranychus urticae TaxID=32264 RepID=T1K5P4_TETUR